MTEFKEISTDELSKKFQKAVKIIDLRSADAYNGWQESGETRGGHIKGAKSLPLKWAKYIDWIEIVKHKGIRPEDELILYGYTKEQTQKGAERFHNAGFENILLYNYFLTEWVTDQSKPMQQLARYQNLVSADWLSNLLKGKKLPKYDNNKFIVVHAHYRNREAYLSGHIPGAIDMDTLALEDSEKWDRRSPEELKKALEQHGITADTTVVLYGKFMHPDNSADFPGSAAGHLGAIRLAFIMMYAGVKDVRVLNGGLQSWKDAGFAIETNDTEKQPVAEFGADIPQKPELAVDLPEAKVMLKSDNADLVCVRSYPEYIGEVSGYNYIDAKGRIPGAIFADCGSDAYHMENYRNPDHTVREFHETAEIWKSQNITPDKHLAFYCGTGWRGSEAWFNAWLMGWPRVSVYDGGWFAWSNEPDNPVETGEPRNN